MTLANLLTLSRLLLVGPFAWFMLQPESEAAAWAALLLASAIVSDLLDGPLARRAGRATAAGGAFDHTTDFLFVASGLVAGAWRGAWTWALPVLVCAAFAQYVADSYLIHRAGTLRGNRLGRLNGILYFVPLCVDILARLGAAWLAPLIAPLAWLLVASTLVSMALRLRAALKPAVE